MIELKQIYHCALCGNVIEVVYSGGGELSCCGAPMLLLDGNNTEAAIEKHVPVLVSSPTGCEVNVGTVTHPMQEKHYIAFIEVVTVGNMVLRAELKPGDEPKAFFPVPVKDVLYVREYCNLHGLWITYQKVPE